MLAFHSITWMVTFNVRKSLRVMNSSNIIMTGTRETVRFSKNSMHTITMTEPLMKLNGLIRGIFMFQQIWMKKMASVNKG